MRGRIVVAAGIVMVLSSAAHSLMGWPAMRAGLEKAAAPEELVGGLAAGWFFGGMAMLAFGVINVWFGLRLARGDRSGVPAIAVISTAYIVFGLCGYVLRDFNSHFLFFMLTGVLAGAPLIALKRQ